MGSVQNWVVSDFDPATKSQAFTAFEAGRKCDLLMEFDTGRYHVEYFELNANEVTLEKTFEVVNNTKTVR